MPFQGALPRAANVRVVDVAGLAERYASDSGVYEELWADGLKPTSLELLARLPLEDARLVLDLGTGVGTLLGELERRAPGGSVIGVDRSFGMLARVPDDRPRAVMDARRLAFAGASFDVVVATFMLFHVPQPDRCLEEVRRVLRPNGAFGMTTWGAEAVSAALSVWDEELRQAGAPEADDVGMRFDDLMDTPQKLHALLARGGLAGETWSGRWTYAQPPADLLRRLLGMGISKQRVGSLSDVARKRLIERARKRWEDLTFPEDFTERADVVLAVARPC